MKKYGILLLLLMYLSTYAQDAEIKHYDLQDGLPSNNVYGVMEDRNGYIWAYTDNGVARFDGYKFKNYNLKNGLGSNDVWLLAEGEEGRLFCYSYSPNFSYIENYKASFVKVNANMASGIYLIQEKGVVYAGVYPHHLAKLFSPSLAADRLSDIISGDPFFNLLHSKQLGFKGWIGINRYFSFSQGSFYILNEKLDTVNIYGVQDNALIKILEKPSINFVGGYCRNPFMGEAICMHNVANYLLRITPSKCDAFNFKGLLDYDNNKGLSFSANKSGDDIVYTDGLGHILKLDSNFKQKDYYDYSYLNKKFPNSRGFIDKNGNIWINTLSNGLFFISKTKRQIRTIQLKVKDAEHIPSLIHMYNNGFIIGTESGALFQLSKNGLRSIYTGSIASISDVAEIRGEAFFAQSGLKKFSNGEVSPYFNNNLVFDHLSFYQKDFQTVFKSITPKNDDTFYVASTSAVAEATYGQQLLRTIDTTRAYDLVYQKNKALWIASKNGLKRWDEKMRSSKLIKENELCVQINKLLLVKDVLWIGTNGLGLYAYHIASDSLEKIEAVEGERIKDLLSASSDKLYVASEKGVESLQRITKKRELFINQGNALPDNDVHCLGLKGDTLLVGTPKGISLVPIGILSNQSITNGIRLTSIKLNEREIDESQLSDLRSNENNLSISFSNLDYARIPSVTYYYRLNKKDPWKQTNKHELNFENLASGDYDFQIYTEGNKVNVLSVPISIATPFYKSAWFYALLAFVVILFFYWQFKQREKKQRALSQKENDINKRIAELELSALQSQMNPHFIFNALGSIQYFQHENVALADEYLGKFARLMRLFLESSKNKFTLVGDEQKLLELYLELEKVRLGDKLSFEINIDEDIDPTIDEIPSLILQPFIENAVNHGLFHKEGPGYIHINMNKVSEEEIQVIIEDNGIGRAAAEEIKAKSLKTHTSRAMQIVQEKLDVLTTETNFRISFQIEDLFDENNKPSGTKASLRLPC